MSKRGYLNTGQTKCYDASGDEILCSGSGQDAEYRKGVLWPHPRFELVGYAVIDHLTDLCWMRKADLTGRPVTWGEALTAVAQLDCNSNSATVWRLPNINELESIVDCSMHSPALTEKHPFVETREGYWSSTTSVFEPDWAWALYLTKGAVGVGQKWGAHFHVWAVCDASDHEKTARID